MKLKSEIGVAELHAAQSIGWAFPCIAEMTREQALSVKRWRMSEELSWRRVALRAYEEWPADDPCGAAGLVPEDAICGRELCLAAGIVLGETID